LAVRQNARAEFDDDARNGFEDVTMHAAKVRKISRAENVKMRGRSVSKRFAASGNFRFEDLSGQGSN
jgi:hypothetical protein